MHTITPCRQTISERFPIASFVVRAPPGRHYEVACATDPRLFHTDYAGQRTPKNFYSSRVEGLHRCDSGDSTWLVPTDQLRRFAGARRIYYALGTYGSPRGDDPRFTIAPHDLEQVPSLRIAQDFTGRSLDRRRVRGGRASAAYGRPDAVEPLRWGGDAVLRAEQSRLQAQAPLCHAEYDDGYDPSLWGRVGSVEGPDPDYKDDGLAVAVGLGAKPGPAPELEPEPDGYEDAVELRAKEGEAYGRPLAGAFVYGGATAESVPEPPGVEHAADLVPSAVAVATQAEPKGVEHAADLSPTVEPAIGGRGKHASYREGPLESSMPVGPASRALSTVPLDIAEKVRLLRLVGRYESGDAQYSAHRDDAEFNDPSHPAYRTRHLGLSWGFVMFTQSSGALGKVLRKAKAREASLREEQTGLPESQYFEALFGEHWQALLDVTDPETTPRAEDRLAPVGGAPLWQAPWPARFEAAGAVSYVQAAQNEVAVIDYFDPMLELAGWLGLRTPRGLALLVDRAIHAGVGAGADWILDVLGPIRSEAERSAALAAVGFAEDLAGFQASKGIQPAKGEWTARTHAALTSALRGLDEASPVAVLSPQAMLRNLLEAARGTDFEARVVALSENTSGIDDSVVYE